MSKAHTSYSDIKVQKLIDFSAFRLLSCWYLIQYSIEIKIFDILSFSEQFIPKKKVVEEEKRDLSENGVIVPPSDSALYIQDTCQRVSLLR